MQSKNKNGSVQLSSRYQQYMFAKRHLRGTSRPEVFPIGGSNPKALKQIISGGQGNRVYDTDGISCTQASQAGGQGAKTGLYAVPVITPDRLKKRQNGRRFKENGEPAFTCTAQDRHGVMIKNGKRYEKETLDGGEWGDWKEVTKDTLIRRLTPLECERLQGFPDGWTKYGINEKGEQVEISDSQRYKTLGNAVSVPVVKEIIKRI